jgi:threonine aldolase
MPEVMEALVRCNIGFAASYGEDAICARAADLIRALLDADAPVWFAASGTAANSLCLGALAQPHEAVVTHAYAHVTVGESGAPGLFGGGLGLIGLPGASGRVDLDALTAMLDEPDHPHWQAPAALSLTQATEYGVVYSSTQLEALIGAAKAKGLKVHLDGARLASAVAAGFDATVLSRLGVDLLVVGGTKAGSTPTEAIVLLNRDLERRFGARLKHGGQLVSKARFLAAPWIGMLENGAFTVRAAHANAMAKRLAALMPFPLVHPVETNGVFVTMDAERFLALEQAGWSVHRYDDDSVRFMCSWATTPEAVDELGAVLRGIA